MAHAEALQKQFLCSSNTNDELNSLFGGFLDQSGLNPESEGTGWSPASDVFETETDIIVIIDIAGIQTQDVSLQIDKDVLIVKGHRRETTGKNRRYYTMEIDFGEFERQVELPSPVDLDRMKASCSLGFLKIELVKQQQTTAGTREISIES
ncbi:MAG: Hsp20/alpha crystallin family protein [Candidatus Electryoneaceae bacterium]|nr:Hsp20/alpha crystallin family protein [Candidatus Electryoneaceae bacterium]